MFIVDTHVHASPYWYEPVESLLFQMEANNVDKAVLVQLEGQQDNRYLFECTRRFPGRFSPIVIIDQKRADATQTLKKLVEEGAQGIRMRAGARSPEPDPLAIWRTCGELNLPVSINGKETEFGSDEFRKLVQALPDVPFIIEHLGFVNPDQQPPYDDFRKVLALAKFSNTYIKVGGLNEICKRPQPFRQPFYSVHGIPPFVKMVYEAFGPKRMMWGSNYPPVSQKEGYANALNYLVEHLSSFCNEADQEWIMGKTALSVFKFQ